MTYFWNFGTPSISRERFELETSNFACRLTIWVTNDKNEKLTQMGSGRGHVTYFWNFGTPSIFRERFELETSNLACRLTTGGTNDNNEKVGQRGSGRGHVTYFCSIGIQILYIFETHGIGQTPSSLERYLVTIMTTRLPAIRCYWSITRDQNYAGQHPLNSFDGHRIEAISGSLHVENGMLNFKEIMLKVHYSTVVRIFTCVTASFDD